VARLPQAKATLPLQGVPHLPNPTFLLMVSWTPWLADIPSPNQACRSLWPLPCRLHGQGARWPVGHRTRKDFRGPRGKQPLPPLLAAGGQVGMPVNVIGKRNRNRRYTQRYR